MSAAARVGALVVVAMLALAGCGDEEEPEDSATATVPTTSAAPGDAEVEFPGEHPEDGPDSDAGEPQEQLERPLSIEDVTTAVLTRSGSPEQGCDELVTERFVTEAYGGRAACLAAREAGGLARALEGTYFNTSGDRARGIVVPVGGPYDGIEVEVELVPDPANEGAWLVDSLVADVPAGP